MNEELQQFARQLASWTELIIENGRSPFRRVDLFPELHTAMGVLQPPLIFWINRQSMMAGGILLLPEQNLDAELVIGRSCCEALGLQHFVTWESDQVRIWQVAAEEIKEHQQFTLRHSDHPDVFRQLLAELLNALKLLAVIGLVPNGQLSAHYLHNLFQTTLQSAQPALINSYRSQRAEAENDQPGDADRLAQEANRLLLLQLLGLAWHQQLPEAILPEKLERGIQISLPQLPAPLQGTLAASVCDAPPELPQEAAVCFHHLLLRLRQLSWRQPEQRAIASMQLLIDSWCEEEPLGEAQVLLYPASPKVARGTEQILSDSPSLLAAIRLLEDLQQQPNKQLLQGNLFHFHYAASSGQQVQGRLTNQRRLTKAERQQYTALLRTSWPNRRFRIGGDKPLWFWELIHLLGLSRQQRSLQLQLPQEAVSSRVSEPFWQLLWENYSIRKLTALNNLQVELELVPEPSQEDPVEVCRNGSCRMVAANRQLSRFRNQLLLALQLPEDYYRLLSEQLSWPETVAELGDRKGLQIYLQSSFFSWLGQLLHLEPEESSASEQEQQLLSLPLPDRLHLRELARAAEAESGAEPDRLLAELLQLPELAEISLPAKTTRRRAATGSEDKSLRDELIRELQAAGIPNFPEQYLYFLDQPETRSYRLTPPLTLSSEFLGEIELQDAAGQTLKVYGQELADALLLSAELGRTEVELPQDRQQLALIQQQYREDLQQLHKQLNSLTHSRMENPKAAAKLSKSIWKKLQLPKL